MIKSDSTWPITYTGRKTERCMISLPLQPMRFPCLNRSNAGNCKTTIGAFTLDYIVCIADHEIKAAGNGPDITIRPIKGEAVPSGLYSDKRNAGAPETDKNGRIIS